MAGFTNEVGLATAAGCGLVLAVWFLYKGVGCIPTLLFGTVVSLAVVGLGALFLSPPFPFLIEGFRKTWAKELAFLLLLGVIIVVAAVPYMVEDGARWAETIPVLTIGPAVIAVLLLPFRWTMWLAPMAGTTRCRSCGVGGSSRASYCSACGSSLE
ncbi:MAG: hypothetical protein WD178_01625 [Actinomycetota bacterium]